jgi:hypothetical protein
VILTLIVVFSFLTGALFAYLATWLTSQKGNTLADIANSPKLNSAEAIKVEILDKVRIASNYPIVGLYVVGAAIPLGIVAYLLFSMFSGSSQMLIISGDLSPRPSDTTAVCITTPESIVQPSGQFTVGLPFDNAPHDINFGGKNYFPETMSVILDKATMKIHIKLTSHGANKPYDIAIDPISRTAALASSVPLEPIPSNQ